MKTYTTLATLLLCLMPYAATMAQDDAEPSVGEPVVLSVTADDVDADGELTLNDITQLISAYLGEPATTGNTDIDFDGQTTVNDITQLIQFYLGVEGD
ncbi:MAG: hypothetical protein IJ901_11800 [Bacteroidaceae bacterium]|nr:hypothetical protein [Bacteroidaceae bacterium]